MFCVRSGEALGTRLPFTLCAIFLATYLAVHGNITLQLAEIRCYTTNAISTTCNNFSQGRLKRLKKILVPGVRFPFIQRQEKALAKRNVASGNEIDLAREIQDGVQNENCAFLEKQPFAAVCCEK